MRFACYRDHLRSATVDFHFSSFSFHYDSFSFHYNG